ncbi:MAG TPA: toll/interleukin-1 receptor domain-containing protein [Phenylobacterium sp.]
MKYAAFISYNHRDRKTAAWLHRALETYRVPRHMHGRETHLGVLGARLPPIFRDREELAASSDLAASVRAALEASATLIVICSPNGAQSRWVNEEIRAFAALGRRDRIQCLIAGGEPDASRKPGADPSQEALPPALFENGGGEPLASDIRPGQDGRDAAKLKLLAGILGVGYDELRQREAARRHRRMAAVAGGSAVGFLVMSALAASAVVSRNEAVRQRDVARQKTLTAERTVTFVKGLFEVADPSEARGATITAREILDRGAASIDHGLEREPTVKAELGTTLGEVYTNLGLLKDGNRLLERMLRIPGVAPGTRARQYLALAEARSWQADDAGAVAAFQKALALARDPASGRADLVPRILSGLGNSQSFQGDKAAGEANIRAALKLDTGADPDGVDVARDLEALGLNAYAGDRLSEARASFAGALRIRTRLQGALHPLAVQDINELGSVAYAQHDSAAAERLWDQALPLNERLYGPNHPAVATSLNNAALSKVERRDYRTALPMLRRAVAINEAQRGDSSSELVFEYTNLGIALRGVGDAAGGESAFRKALVVARLNKHRNLAPILVDLADTVCDRGDTAEGEVYLDEAGPLMARTYPKDPWRSAWVETIRGNCRLRGGKRAEALRVLAPAAPVVAQRWPAGSHYGARAAELLAKARAAS